ncbi:MAG: hypothetical protein GX960_02040, partial [Actinomycetales bacterium]|nr:hypothetical protein [Actinomycetales bacterium]
MPMVEELWIPVPLPTVLVVLGIAAGILIGIAGGLTAALASSWHRRRARRVLMARVREVAQREVVDEVESELARATGTARDLALAHG